MGLLPENDPARVYITSAARMDEVGDQTARLLIGASVYLGKGVPWAEYAKLYRDVYVKEGLRVIRPDGVFVVIQTNAYENGQFICRYHNLLKTVLDGSGWRLIDERVWQRRRADHFQVPFSHVLIFAPDVAGAVTRNQLNKNHAWFRGVWDYPQSQGGAINGYPDELCKLLIESCTKPGDLVVDPFAGTGRLLGLAAKTGRDAVGYEINPELVPILRQNNCRPLRRRE